MHNKYVFSEEEKEYYGYGWKSITPDNNSYISDANSTWEGHLGGAPPISNFRIAKDYELGCFYSCDINFEYEEEWNQYISVSQYLFSKVLQVPKVLDSVMTTTSILSSTNTSDSSKATNTTSDMATPGFNLFLILIVLNFFIITHRFFRRIMVKL